MGQLIYGPAAFFAGLCYGSNTFLLVVPAAWFIGMFFSHVVFDRCVLIESVSRLKKFINQTSPLRESHKPQTKSLAVKTKTKLIEIKDENCISGHFEWLNPPTP